MNTRTHLSLGKDAPASRPATPRSAGRIIEISQVNGLHHRYDRAAAWGRFQQAAAVSVLLRQLTDGLGVRSTPTAMFRVGVMPSVVPQPKANL
jgi:hypothetical protein